MTVSELRSELAGVECHGCGGAKEMQKTFCRRCYYALPPRMRKALYSPIGDGYEEAREEAGAFLRDRALHPRPGRPAMR